MTRTSLLLRRKLINIMSFKVANFLWKSNVLNLWKGRESPIISHTLFIPVTKYNTFNTGYEVPIIHEWVRYEFYRFPPCSGPVTGNPGTLWSCSPPPPPSLQGDNQGGIHVNMRQAGWRSSRTGGVGGVAWVNDGRVCYWGGKGNLEYLMLEITSSYKHAQ